MHGASHMMLGDQRLAFLEGQRCMESLGE